MKFLQKRQKEEEEEEEEEDKNWILVDRNVINFIEYFTFKFVNGTYGKLLSYLMESMMNDK